MVGFELVEFMPAQHVRPATDWLFNMATPFVQSRILQRFNRIRSGSLGDFKSLGYDLFEFREFFQTGYRIYFVRHTPNQIILLCAGSKNTQKRDIDRARDLQRMIQSDPSPKFYSYSKTIQAFLQTYQGTLAYIESHQNFEDVSWSGQELWPVMLADLVKAYGYAWISNQLGIAMKDLYEMIVQKRNIPLSLSRRLQGVFYFDPSLDLPTVVNQ